MNNPNETNNVTESKYKYYNFAFFGDDLQDIFNDIFFLMEYEYHKLSNIVNEKCKFIINAEDYSLKGSEYDSDEALKTVLNQKDNKLYFIKTGQNYIDFSALMKCRYPSIIRIKGFGLNNFEYINNLTIFTDYYDKTLNDYIKAEGKKSSGRETILTTRDYIIILGITIAMMHIHKFGFQYTILSPLLIFLDENYYPIISTIESQKTMQRIRPPLAYTAQEYHRGIWMLKSNVFSFSFILFEILTRKYPIDCFETLNFRRLIRLISSSSHHRIELVKNDIFIELLQKCWDQNPRKRLTFIEILEFITRMEFCSCFQPFDYESIKKYLDIYGDEFSEMKIKMHNIAFKLNDLK